MTVNSGYNLDSLVVPTLAAATYAAQENSLYLTGQIIPMEMVPAGSTSLQVPLVARAATALKDNTSSVYGSDYFAPTALTDTKVTIEAGMHVSPHILRDAGQINPAAIGTQAGKAVARSFDLGVTALFKDFDTNTAVVGSGTNNALTVPDLFKAAAVLRAAEVQGMLYAILHPYQAYNLKNSINSAAFAGSELQSTALRSGFIGMIAGIAVFESALLTEDVGAADHLWEGIVFGEDAMRIAMQRNVFIETQRAPTAVGVEIVASLIAGVGIVDAAKGVQVKSTGIVIET